MAALAKRDFLKLLGLSALGGLLFFTQEDIDTLKIIQEDLLPPLEMISNEDVGARAYLSYIFCHPRVPSATKDSLKQALRRLDGLSKERFAYRYGQLSYEKRGLVLQEASRTWWGESMIETMLGFLFEAYGGDPIYGVNKNALGWRWLGHTPGLPRPKRRYDG